MNASRSYGRAWAAALLGLLGILALPAHGQSCPGCTIAIHSPSEIYRDQLNGVTVTLHRPAQAAGFHASLGAASVPNVPSGLTVTATLTGRSSNRLQAYARINSSGTYTEEWRLQVTVAATALADFRQGVTYTSTNSIPVRARNQKHVIITGLPGTSAGVYGPLVLAEGSSGTYAVRLNSVPTASVTVTLASADAGAVTVDTSTNSGLQNTLTFTTANWNTAQTVTANAVGDADFSNESVAITHTASGGGYTNSQYTTATLNAEVVDDEAAEVLVDANPATAAVDAGPLVLNEASALTGSYSVHLSRAPTASVTVALASDNAAVTLSASSLTFTTANWNTAQTVTATTTTDADAVDEAADVTHTASGGGYAGLVATLRVGVADAQRTGTDYDADEDGLIDIANLAQLNAMRWDLDGDGSVTGGNASDYTTAFPGASTGMGCPDGGDSDQTPDSCQGYELTQDLDFDTDGSGFSWTEAAGVVSGDPNDAYYDSGSGWDPIGPASGPNDNTHFKTVFDGNGYVIRNLFINRTRSYTALFAALRPDAEVRNLGLPDAAVTGGWSSALLAGWSWGRVAGVWTTGRVQAPGNVGGIVGVMPAGTVVASYSRAAVACTATGASAKTGGLVGDNRAGATIAASYATGMVSGACPTAAKGAVTTGAGTVAASYWDATTSGIEDDTDADPPEGRSTSQLQAPTEYGSGIYAEWRIQDVDGDGVRGEPTGDDAWNFGTDAQYPVLKIGAATQFEAQPPSFGQGSVAQMSFRTGIAITPFQVPAATPTSAVTYTVSGLPDGLSFDADATGACAAARTICGTPTRTGSFTVTISATNTAGVSADLVFTLVVGGIEIDADPDTPSTTDAGPLALEEDTMDPANSDTYAVRLTSAPTASITITATSGDPGAATVDTDAAVGLQSTLTFTTANWSTWQTVTAQALQDADAGDETVTITHTASGTGYAGVEAPLIVTVNDATLPEVLVDANPGTAAVDDGPLLLNEASARSRNYSVRLIGRPNAAVTVTTTSDNPAVTVNRATLTFTPSNWSTAQTVTATTTTDADAVDEAADVTHAASGGGYDGVVGTLRVGVRDAQRTGTDYDTDEDGLIEINALAQLNAVRWDLDGNGNVTGTYSGNYANAFPSASAGMGCPDGGDADQTPDDCIGYELTRDLNFDTDGSGAGWSESGGDLACDANDSYYNSGSGWDPIGPSSTPTDTTHFTAVFEGNGHVIDNLCIDRTGRSYVGLFAALRPAAEVRALGLTNAGVYSGNGWSTATLAGQSWGRIAGVWTTGTVRAPGNVGGLVGVQNSGGTIVASYSTAAVHCTNSGAFAHTGGLVGASNSGATVAASYSTGAVTGACPTNRKYGLTNTTGTVTASYWDTISSGIEDDNNALPPEGRTTNQLQTPTAYGTTGLYASWSRQDVDDDGVGGEFYQDDAWSFGTDRQYPVLKLGGLDPAEQLAAQPPSFGAGAVAQMSFRTGVDISAFQIPAATHTGAITYSASGLPDGLTLDADATGECAAVRTICGAPTRTGTFEVTIWATNAAGARAGLSFTLVVGGIEIDVDPDTTATVDAGPLALAEDANSSINSDTYAVRLTSAPSVSVTVTVASSDTGAVTVDQAALTFTTANWNTWQTVTAQAVQDADSGDEAVPITHSASGGGYDGVSAPLTAAVEDDEAAWVLVDPEPATPAVLERGSLLLHEASAQAKNYAVKLSGAPNATMTVALAVDNPAVTVNPALLTFTTANWDTGQAVTARTTADADAVDEAAIVTHTASGGGFDGAATTLRVGVSDAQRTGTDYDADEDGLIDIDSLAKLNAVRWDLNGDGAVSAGDQTNYQTAFPGASAGMGCPDGADADQTQDACIGYELTRDLDFDTDGDGGTYTGTAASPTSDSDDAYHNGGSGWDPIGPDVAPTDSTHFNAVFDGNGHVIRNLFMNRSRGYVGLFAALRPAAVVRGLGLPGALVRGNWSTAPVAGQSWGRVAGVWVTGSVRGVGNVGGLVGVQQSGGTIVASYSMAPPECTGTGTGAKNGGLVGDNQSGATIAGSYSTGAVTGTCAVSAKSGFTSGGGTVRASYWDTTSSNYGDDQDANPPEGRSTAQLQAPTAYGTGLYATWDEEDVDDDGVAGAAADRDDDAWDFGSGRQHPVLKFAGFDTELQFNSQGTDSAPTFGGAMVAMTFGTNIAIEPFRTPVATAGNGAIAYSATGLPAGLSFDADGSGACGAARTICGTPTVAGTSSVTVTAVDHDDNTHASDRGTLTVSIEVVAPTATLSSNPTPLTEGNLDGAALTVTLANTAFLSGVAQSNFTLTTGVSGLQIASLQPVAAGDATAVLTLAYDGTDFDSADTVSVTVAASAHAGTGALATATLAVSTTLDVTITPQSLSLTEASGGTNAGTYTVALEAAPAATTTVRVASSDTGAATVDLATLTFTTTNWNTAQTVTVTAQQDADSRDESVAILHTSGGSVGSVTVTVTDDDRGTVLVDVDPSTDAVDPGPVALADGDTANYRVRLSAAPTGDVSVSVTSADAGAVLIGTPVPLTFTMADWNTAQTVGVGAPADSDALDESVVITHTASGGGYGGTSTELRVIVSDGTRSGTDYDTDEDGLIEIATLAQLNAVRWDLDGNGTVSATDQTNYNTAFPGASTGMGCPAVSGTATCTGYELVADLDFDTDGDGSTWSGATPASDSGDDYHNSGAGWSALGNRSAAFSATFDGNGHVVYNLFLNRTGTGNSNRDAGLFGALATTGVVRSLGVADAQVRSASDAVGALVGRNLGRIEACWTSGAVTANSGAGGLSGSTDAGSAIVASYSTASVTLTGSAGAGGGLVGWISGDIAASYSTGAVTGGTTQHGLAGGSGAAIASYWDTETSGLATSTKGAGRTTAQLQSPTSAIGPYAGWDGLDLDGDGDPAEAPWDFGTSAEYPVLRVGANAEASVFVQRGDYDLDDDGLIDVYTLAQLNAIRWDLDGDGAPASGNSGTYRSAFRHHRADMGCPTNGDDVDANDCAGFELVNDLDFDTDGDDRTHTAGTGDAGDAYYNSGAGWVPIGTRSTPFDTTFDGKGKVIDHLFVNRATTGNPGRDTGLFGGTGAAATVTSVGLPNAHVTGASASVGALVGRNGGRVAASWATGAVSGTSGIGGLIGTVTGADSVVVASYSTASVTITAGTGGGAGLVGWNGDGTIRTSYSTGAVTGGATQRGFSNGGGTVAASYWDTDGSSIADDGDADPPEGRSRALLRAPTGYTGLYADWDDQDVDGDGTLGEATDDDAWHFGDAFTHPVLKFGGFDVNVQFGLQPNNPPTFSATLPNVTVANGQPIDAIQAPTATGGEGVGYTYSATGLPTGLVFDEDGTGTCQQARTICGTPSGADGAATVTVYAHDGDVNRAASDRGALTFTLTVTTPTATISATSPAMLTEATLDGATATVTLTNSTFASGVGVSGFRLNTGVPGLSVSSVTATGGTTTATLTLGHTGADFDSAQTLGVTVLAAAHALKGDVTTATVSVETSLEATASPANVSLQEAAGSTMANEGTFTAVLQSAPQATTTVAVASLDQGAVTVSPSTLTFTTSDWNTAQTVTVTAQQDDDADDETTTVTLTAAGVGVLASVTVTVDDDDAGTVLVDADPTTAALDPGPLLAAEGDAPSYAVRLSARPTGDVTVDVTSGDTGAVDVAAGSASLTFTTADWNTAQTVQLGVPSDADALDESATITHTATGGGYGGTSAELRVAVSDGTRSGTDYDTDEDGLIEIASLAQLNAVRWDLDGNGAVAMTDSTNYNAAFPSASASMGCPAVSGTATCTGYELAADLDFDTDGDGTTHTNGTGDSGDSTYYNSGAGFAPIGNRSAGLEATFDGNGHVVYNLFVNRTTAGNAGRDTGLFGAVGTAGVVRNVGVADAWVSSASDAVGALVGRHYGRVEACWASGSVTANSGVGGLAGSTDAGSAVVASYSTASVTVSGSAGGGGGLAGWNAGDVAASYATGAVTGGAAQHGLANGNGGATSSYWDTEASGVANSTFGAGRTTSQLQSPTSATGPFASWGRLDLDGDDDPSESPWDFGTSSEYPALRVGANAEASVLVQRGDYDLDDDGLIDVYTLAQLNAVRWDMDGNGASSDARFRAAFRHHREDMGCPTSTIDADDNDCAGFELMNDLDFDTDGDRSTHTNGASDSGDAYHNGGSGWDPIGAAATTQSPPTDSTHFNTVFDGKGHVIHNLFIDRSRTYVGLFGALRTSAVVRALGLRDAWVDGGWSSAPLAGQSWGRTAAVWASGTVEAPGNLGGLVGVLNTGGTIVASYSTASVECTNTTAAAVVGGLVADAKTGSTVAASYSTGAVTGNCPATSKGGLLLGGGTVAASYWDTTLSGINDDQDSNPPEGESTVDLQTPTEYGATGLYATWDDQDVDGDSVPGEAEDDDAWEFGLANQHPVLKYGGLDTTLQFNQQPDIAPSFSFTVIAAPSNVTVQNGQAITPIRIPPAGAGNGTVTIAVTGLPAGLSFDADGTGTCQQARTICGTPGTNGASPVTVTATDSDANTQPTDQATLTFTITVVTPSAAITATNPAALTEANLNNATVTVTLTNTTFGSGVTASSFTVTTGVSGVSVDSITPVSSGDTSANLVLAYGGADFDTAQTLSVTVAGAAHALVGSLSTGTVAVAPTPGVTVSPTMLSLHENPTGGGGTSDNVGTYSVVLESQPAASVTVTATSADAAVHIDTDGTPLTFALTFTTANWATAQTVTATAQQDDDGADESVSIAHAVTGYTGVTTATSVTVAVDDDESPGIVLDAMPSTPMVNDPGPLALNELGSATNNSLSYAVKLSAEPTATVTVTITSADAGAVAVADTDSVMSGVQNTLSFTTANWDTAQTATVTAQDDADGVHESVIVTHTATTTSTSEYTNLTATITATVQDDEAPGFVFDADTSTPSTDDAEPLNLDELAGSTTNADDYSVRLTSQPTQTVTVTITSPDTGAVTVGTSTLTFTTANWDTAQTVTATAVQDLDGADESVDIAHAASTATNSEYTGVSGTFEAAVDDDETPAITLSPTSLNVNEQNSAAYTVRLATQPKGGGVTIAITGAANGISANPTSLSFTTTNWNTARTVTASAIDDLNSANETATLTHTATGADYDTLTADLEVTALDDDQPSLNVSTGALTVPENASRAYTIRLNTQPSAAVTVTVGGAASGVTADTDGATTGDQNTLTFTTTNWDTNQTVTVSAAEDDNGVDETVALSHTASGGGYGSLVAAARPGVTVTADDNDTPGIELDAVPSTPTVNDPGPLALNELASAPNNSLSYSVKLATQPTATVTVTVTSADAGAVAVADTDSVASGVQNTLTFTTANWDTAQTVTVTAQDDADGVGESVLVTHTATTASSSEYSSLTATITATVTDEEAPGFVFDADPSTPSTADAEPLNLDELAGSTTNADDYSVRLSAQPTQTVTVTITSPDTGAATVGTSTLTFTTSNWDTAQTVTVTAQQDLDGADESVEIAHAASTATNSEYTGVSGTFEAAVDDDETPAITLSPTALNVNEQNTATYTVQLATEPKGGSVTVAITGAGSGISINVSSLTFTASNWNTARTVTASAADDTNSANEAVTLTHTATGADYDTLTADLEVTALDNDQPSLNVSTGSLTVPENASRTYTIRLNTQPSAAVTVTVNGAGSGITVDTDGATTGDQNTLTFTTTNWDTNQTVTVSAAEDDNGVDEEASLSHTASGGDYGSLMAAARPGVSVTADDNDTPAVLLDANPTTPNMDEAGPLALQELMSGTNTASYTVRLGTEPPASVTVTIASADANAVSVNDTDSVTSGVQNTLTFTTANWDTAQTVTLTAEQDADGVPETVVVTNAASTVSMSEYANLTATITATVEDDETPGFVFDADPSTPSTDDAEPLNLDELAGSTTNSDDYSVRLAAQPTQAVTVTVSSPDTGAVTVGTSTLTFTTANWDTAQTVTLTAAQDLDGADESVDIAHAASSATSSEYTGVSATFEAAVDDDETPAITVSPTTLTVPERDTATYTVVLATEPKGGNVTVAITGAADGLSASPTSLTFTASNWNTARTVTARAADDQNSANEVVTLTHTATGADYDTLTADIELTASDDDQPGLRVSPTALTVREGASRTYTIRLNTEPSAGVTVTVGGTTAEVTVDTDRDATGDQTTLTFTTANWRTTQTVTVSVGQDDDATDEMVSLTHAASGGDYTGLLVAARPGVAVSVDDDDTPAILIDADATTPNVDERGPLALNELAGDPDKTRNYTVRLATEPTQAVTVAVTSGDRAVSVDTDGTPRTLTLTFTTANWGTAQTVAAVAAEDDDASNERVAIAHAASGGDYDGVSAELVANTVDDDEPAIDVVAATLVANGVVEGAIATYTVRLETEPAGIAVVSVAATGDATVDMDGQQAGIQSSLRFDATTWNVPRTVIVHGAEDDDGAAGMATLRHTSSGADYGRAPAVEIMFAVADDDALGVAVAPTSVDVNEDATATYTVTLGTAPVGGPVTVTPTTSDADVATASPAALTFTAGNWNRPQRVTVAGVADSDATDGSATITHAVSGGDYGAVTALPVAVAVRDTEAAGVRIEPPTLTLREGARGTYRVRLNTEPAGDVTVTATSATAALAVDEDETPQSNVLTFTTANWATAQTVRVSAASDDDAADAALSIAHAVSGYAGVATAPALPVNVEDDDAPGMRFAPAAGVSLSEADPATTATYTVVLTAQPTATVTVALSSDDAGLAFDADGAILGDQTSTTFTTANWDTARTVTVRAVADGDAATETATLLHAASGGGYDDVSAGYPVRLSDADAAAAPASVTVRSAGPRSLSVSWTASANAEAYLVQWRVPGGAWSTARQMRVAATAVRIDDLETGTRYEVRVIGLNRGDPGNPSAPAEAMPSALGNRAPAATGELPELALGVGETRTVDMSALFVDPDGDELTFLAWSSDESVVTAWAFGAQLRVRGVGTGAAEIGLRATDPTGASATRRLPATVGAALSLAADAEAPEGGTARLQVTLSSPRATATTFRWRAVADADPATADADADDHGDAAGEATIPAGETSTEIAVPIADDEAVEPAREWFEVAIEAPANGCCTVRRARARVAVLEGVCDRTPAVADALRGSAACTAPTPAALASRTRLAVTGAGTLRADDFQGLASLQWLDLSANGLSALPEGAFAGASSLRELDLSNNALAALPPQPFAALRSLRVLDLSGNGFAALPEGLFAGLSLREASLADNPGAPFALAVELARTDADRWADGPATVETRLPAGAPFPMRLPLTAEPTAEGLPTLLDIPAGAIAAEPFAATAPATGALTLRAGAATLPPATCGAEWPFRACFRGLAPMPSEALTLFRQPPRAMPAPTPEPLAGDELRLPLASLIAAGDGALRWRVSSSDESVATARILGGNLLVEPELAAEGTAEIVLVATDSAGLAATVRFEVRVEFFAPMRPNTGWRSAVIGTPQIGVDIPAGDG